MFDIGFTELMLLAVIGMVVIGPERLPGVARTVGRTVGKARRFMTGLQNQLEQEVRLDELNKKIIAETKGQTFKNNDETGAGDVRHENEDAEVPSIAPRSALDETAQAELEGDIQAEAALRRKVNNDAAARARVPQDTDTTADAPTTHSDTRPDDEVRKP
ncbi:Sec-independent protein translocase protein TatB [Saccharospirillum impatiens]|uniref:Sec-independent protein translocase protein TatB n=1 Tax=Saccharospirillum impatiens TaxID=169438 RepID=UPI000401DDCE|nr:Sec-independent protein translocase protein TatB [Saccharospirillum impatiens]